MKKTICCLIFLSLLVVSQAGHAQERFGVELRPGANVPTSDLGDADIGTGFGAELTVAYRFLPHLGAYAGWGWQQFQAEESFLGTDSDFEETGYTFGLQFVHPVPGISDRVHALVRAGGIFNHIEGEDSAGEMVIDSGHGFGWQVGAGAVIRVAEQWRLVPTVRYRSLPQSMEFEETELDTDLSYVSMGIGLVWVR